MANMIPDIPRKYDPRSLEGNMFNALSKLSNEYYIFHSFRITDVVDNEFRENETDFIIYHREKGVICLEAKAGAVYYKNGYWYYGSGLKMHNEGPFNQASSNKWKLMKHIKNSKIHDILKHCKVLHGVWFPSVNQIEIKKQALPPEASLEIILTKEALDNPEPFIERIYALDLPNKVTTEISEQESAKFIREILCPEFGVFPTASFENDLKKDVFHKLLKEQESILNFLVEQKTAVISGVAGTGKTMIALEKARRHAAKNEKVLFLCYNNKLCDYLAKCYGDDNIDFYTIAGLACKVVGSKTPNYAKLSVELENMWLSNKFPYNHIIVDEGQDFGMDSIEEADVLQSLRDIVVECQGGTFYLFYDKFQMIQARTMSKFIQNADCKLTLYKNCRNTENIARASTRLITDKLPNLYEYSVTGAPVAISFCCEESAVFDKLDSVIDSIKDSAIKDIVILTCKTESSTLIHDKVVNGKYLGKYEFTTCRKFKGLEADAVILIDVDKDTFEVDNKLLYYVGASRARLKLDVITTLSDDEIVPIVKEKLNFKGKIKNPKRALVSELHAVAKL